jgi:hypothetical protein
VIFQPRRAQTAFGPPGHCRRQIRSSSSQDLGGLMMYASSHPVATKFTIDFCVCIRSPQCAIAFTMIAIFPVERLAEENEL